MNDVIQLESLKFKLSKDKLKQIYLLNDAISIDLFRNHIERAIYKDILLKIQQKIAKKLIENKREVNLTLSVAECGIFFLLHKSLIAGYHHSQQALLYPIISMIDSKL